LMLDNNQKKHSAMAIEISVNYHAKKITYLVEAIGDEIYTLRLNSTNVANEFVPNKLVIRRKGKIWITDMENYKELAGLLINELFDFKPNNTA
ncbi:MAG TPA: hypothetical protein VGO09_03590, partial [Flavisolibacter sp.]|nr:hypothetical protein [Flavisolibacter sp.]